MPTLYEGLNRLEQWTHGCVLLNLGLPDAPDPAQVLRVVMAAAGPAPVVVLSGHRAQAMPAVACGRPTVIGPASS